MQPNPPLQDPQTPAPNDNQSQPGTHGLLTIQPLSSEESIREAAAKATTIITQTPASSVPPEEPIAPMAPSTPEAPHEPPVSQVVEMPTDPVPAPMPKKHRIRFAIFLLLALGQIYWLGDLSVSALSTLNSGRLVFSLAGVLLGSVVLVKFIQMYRFNGFNFVRRRDKIYAVLGILPVVIYILGLLFLFLAVLLKSFEFSILLLSLLVLGSSLAWLVLVVAAIGLGGVIRKRTGFGRIVYLWPLLLLLLSPLLTAILAGNPQGSEVGIVEKAQLDQAKANMSSYLNDRYGMDFVIQAIQFKDKTTSTATRAVTAKVSPAKDPSFSYSVGAYLYKDVSAKGEIKDAVKYQEDFIGEYWKDGFEKTICPQTNSYQKSITVANCSVTSYNLGTNYNTVLLKYRGNVPKFEQLDATSKALINFGLTIKTTDDNYANNVPQHADFLTSLKSSVQSTHSTSNIHYHSTSNNSASRQLTYYGTTDASTVGGQQRILTHIYEEEAGSVEIPGEGKNVLYYDPQTAKFDLAKPEV